MHDSIQDTFQLLRRTVEEDIIIKETFCDKALTVMGDPVQLQQVILNLVVNARDAIHLKQERNNNEHISINTNVIDLENTKAVETIPPGKYVEII